ncbi:4121_t:CDS:1, partial [Cetraspora pellucida]
PLRRLAKMNLVKNYINKYPSRILLIDHSEKLEFEDLENQKIQTIQDSEKIQDSKKIKDSEKINVITNRLATLKNRLDVLEDLLKTFYLDTSFLDRVKEVREEIVNENGNETVSKKSEEK